MHLHVAENNVAIAPSQGREKEHNKLIICVKLCFKFEDMYEARSKLDDVNWNYRPNLARLESSWLLEFNQDED